MFAVDGVERPRRNLEEDADRLGIRIRLSQLVEHGLETRRGAFAPVGVAGQFADTTHGRSDVGLHAGPGGAEGEHLPLNRRPIGIRSLTSL